MPTLHICPLHERDRLIEESRASHLVSLLSVGTPDNRPGSIHADNHLAIGVSDIVEALDGHVLAGPEHIAPLIDFARRWPREAPMVVHCWAGISRSTPAGFIIACVLAPERDEADIARALRAASPTATPNRRFVAVADDLLGRGGRMVAAIEAIGRGAEAPHGTTFVLPLD